MTVSDEWFYGGLVLIWWFAIAVFLFDRGRVRQGRIRRPVVGIMAIAVACVSSATWCLAARFERWTSPSPSSEAFMNLRRLQDASVAHFVQHGSFPPSSPMAPPGHRHMVRCESGSHRFESGFVDWSQGSAWSALSFELHDPHRYSYQYDSSQFDGRWTYTASAFGDLDCDARMSTFVRFGVEASDGSIVSESRLYTDREFE